MTGRRKRRLSIGSSVANTNTQSPSHENKDSFSFPSQPPATEFADLGTNDDITERTNARRSRKRRRSVVQSPSIRSRSRSRRRPRDASEHSRNARRTQIQQLSHKQLTDMYQNCINLSNLGKISLKNAWELRLTEHITEIINLSDDENDNEQEINDIYMMSHKSSNEPKEILMNFTRASHAIVAASKIYGYRVDSVHNATYKVLGSIHQNTKNEPSTVDSDGNIMDDISAKRHRRNRNVGKSTIVEKRETLQLSTDMSAQIDPMFHKTATAFDEYGARGLLMNNLYIKNQCEIIFDSTTKIEQNEVFNDEYNEAAVELEQKWMFDLYGDTFSHPNAHNIQYPNNYGISKNCYTSQFSQVLEYDANTFAVDIDWLKHTEACRGIKAFVNLVNDEIIEEFGDIPLPSNSNMNTSKSISLPAHIPIDYNSDNDIVMDMPDITNGMNVSFRLDDEYIPADISDDIYQTNILDSVRRSEVIRVPQSFNSGMPMIPMEIHSLDSVDMNNTAEIIAHLEKEQENGIRKRTMNISAMNDIISKLERSELDSLTTFFDPKKKSNWAGPNKCYYRRQQLIRKPIEANNNHFDSDESLEPKKKKYKKQKYIDFISIANGNFVDKSLFTIPKTSNNCLTKGVLNRNENMSHLLPNDIKIKPDLFVKLFLRPEYSVWRHLLKQHKINEKRIKNENETNTNEIELNPNPNILNISRLSGNASMNLSALDISMMNMNMSLSVILDERQILAEQAAATMAVLNASNINIGDNISDDGAFYNNMGVGDEDFRFGDIQIDDKCVDFSQWNINGMEMVESPMIIQKLKVQFSRKRKKIDVRKLKSRMWNQFINKYEQNKSDVQNDGNDIHSYDKQLSVKLCTFGDIMDGLPKSSVPFCFMTMLLLANEKRLVLLPKMKDGEIERSNFFVSYADDCNQDIIYDNNVQPVMVLGN